MFFIISNQVGSERMCVYHHLCKNVKRKWLILSKEYLLLQLVLALWPVCFIILSQSNFLEITISKNLSIFWVVCETPVCCLTIFTILSWDIRLTISYVLHLILVFRIRSLSVFCVMLFNADLRINSFFAMSVWFLLYMSLWGV